MHDVHHCREPAVSGAREHCNSWRGIRWAQTLIGSLQKNVKHAHCFFFHHPTFFRWSKYDPENDAYERLYYCFKCFEYR